jgi:hypothetical protein
MKNIIKTFNVLAVILLLASCSDDYLDINVDPNNPLTVTPDLLLPVALNYSAFANERNRGMNTLGNMMMYNWSQSDGFSWYLDEFAYLVTPSFYQQNFDYVYSNALKQYTSLLEVEGAENGYYHAIAKIMIAYHFQLLVDQYGDVPYSEALLRGENPTPDMITATDGVDGAIRPGDDDGMYSGNMDEWKAFANSVKLRILVRQIDMSGRAGYIQSELAAIAAEGSGFVTDDVGVNIGYVQQENQQNPKWDAFGQDVSGANTLNNDATCATPFLLDYLDLTNDGRLDFIYERPGTGHLGVPQGLEGYDETEYGVDGLVPGLVSNIGPGILKGPDQDAILMTLAEVYFNQAEAVLKGAMSGDAGALYDMGVSASFSYLGAGSAAAYLAQPKQLVNYDFSNNKLEAIITQKWIAVNGIDASQSWFDYNRTGYPSNLPISLQAFTSDRPVRLFYPSSEITSNGLNLPAQPDAFSSKIFWAN